MIWVPTDFKIKVYENYNFQMMHPKNIMVGNGDSLSIYSKGIEPKEIFHWASI